MGDGALTKAQLDELTIEWRRWRAERGEPVEPVPAATKSVRSESALSSHDKALLRGIASAFHDEIEALKMRIAELESGTMKYLGVHQASIAYRKGNVVSYDGSAWCATRDVSVEKPGHGDGWQLMVKRGKDAPAVSEPRADPAPPDARNGSFAPANPRFR
jgi:hypothetical protein